MINDPVEAEATWTVTLQIPDWPSGRTRVVPFWSSAAFRISCLGASPINPGLGGRLTLRNFRHRPGVSGDRQSHLFTFPLLSFPLLRF
jgi:hypothetical protein